MQKSSIILLLFGVGIGLAIYHLIIVSPTIKEINCPDGRVCLVFTDPRRAFSYDSREITVVVEGLLEALQDALTENDKSNLDAKSKVEIRNKTETMIKELDNINGDLEKHYLAAYSSFLARPCDDDAYKQYQKQLENIRNSQERLRKKSIPLAEDLLSNLKQGAGISAVEFAISGLVTSVAELEKEAFKGTIARLGEQSAFTHYPVIHEVRKPPEKAEEVLRP